MNGLEAACFKPERRMFYYSPYLILPLFSSLATCVLAVYLFKRRKQPAAPAIFLIMSLISVWALAYTLQTASTGVWLKVFTLKLGTVCTSLIAPTFLAISMEASGFSHWPSGWPERRKLLLLMFIPSLIVLSFCIREIGSLAGHDHLLRSGPLLVLAYKPSRYFKLQFIYGQILFFASLVLLLTGIVRGPNVYRVRSLLLLLGTVVPLAAEDLALTPYKGFHAATSTLWFSGLCYTLAIVRFRLLDILPAARSALFEELGEPVFVLDSSGKLVDCNRATYDMFMPDKKGKRSSLFEALQKRFPEIAGITASPATPVNKVFADQDWDGGYWQVLAKPLNRRGRFLGTLVQLHDITGLKSAEETMRRAQQSAEEANRMKSSFLATVSHELRTPLQAIIGFSEIVLELDASEAVARYMAMINDASVSLLDLINDLLDFSRIEAGKMELSPIRFSLRTKLENIGGFYAHLAERKGIAFSLHIAEDVPEFVSADPVRVRQVLINIIGNAVKFTEKGGVSVSAFLCAPDGENEHASMVCFTVRDTGIGIPEDKKETVFKNFAQADPEVARLYGGSGLGAGIALQLCRLMGGNITFESREGEGSTFRIVIPFEIAQSPLAGRGVENGNREDEKISGPLSIMLVEDNLFNQRLMVDALTLRGHTVTLACNGGRAVEQWRSGKKFDLVLMDLMMPVLSGYEAVRNMRAEEVADGRKRIPIVAVTANVDDSVRKRCLEAGFDGFITKPVTMSALDGLIGRFWSFPSAEACSPLPLPLPIDGRALFDSRMVSVMDENPERVCRYAALLLKDLDRGMTLLEAAFASRDNDAISRAAHGLKGATIAVKASNMSTLADQLRVDADGGDSKQMEAGLANIRKSCEQLRAVLKKAGSPRDGQDSL